MRITIRQEVTSDFAAVFDLIAEAFSTELLSDHQEQFLVERLRRSNAFIPELSLVASTVRHNRARGKHSVQGMSNMVFEMLENGWEDAAICNELGMEPEELLRLKHITGFSKLFADVEYKKAWVTRRQILIQKRFEESQRAGTAPTAPARAPAKRGKASAVPKRSAEALPA